MCIVRVGTASVSPSRRERIEYPPVSSVKRRLRSPTCTVATDSQQLPGSMTTSKLAVLFLCVHNAGRSQMAAGWLRHMAGETVDIYSGGSEPGEATTPPAVAAMAGVGLN